MTWIETSALVPRTRRICSSNASSTTHSPGAGGIERDGPEPAELLALP
jgi:hypothetical protein